MVKTLLVFLGLLAPDLSSAVAVNAAYTLHTVATAVPEQCCGQCRCLWVFGGRW